jgi:hypothetical protein
MRKRQLKRVLERSGWLVFCLAMAGTLGVLGYDGPRWAAGVLVAVAFLVSVALMGVSIRKGWQHH